MPRGTWNIEWLNHNSQRAYPLSDDATKQDTTTEFTLPDSFLLALYFPVHAGLAVQPEKFFLRSVSVFSTGYNIALGYDDGTNNPPIVASVNIAKSTHVENTSYALPGSGDYDDSVGKVIIGTLLDIDDAGAGQYFFNYADGKLDPDTIRPIIRGVSSITLVQGADESERIYGDIELVAGSNIRLTPIVVGQNQQIRIDAIRGEGLNEDCICDGDEDAIPITTINGIPPTPQGNFTLLGSNCLEITAISNGLQLDDTCSEPCCGCKELEAITRDLDRFGDAALTLKNFINRLEAEVTQMSSVVLGSRLNDQGCLEC
jgi:hypothetical protein